MTQGRGIQRVGPAISKRLGVVTGRPPWGWLHQVIILESPLSSLCRHCTLIFLVRVPVA